jgi:hypothetical protein
VSPEGSTPYPVLRILIVSRHLVRCCTAIALLLAIQGITGCRTQVIEEKEDSLAAAGFILRPANTPERVAMLKRLPPNRFVRREHGDAVHYVYADPIVCSCLYVGTQQAYAQYLRDRQQKAIVDQQQLAAQEYSDAAWNWGAWGPWGPGYGFGYAGGFGW